MNGPAHAELWSVPAATLLTAGTVLTLALLVPTFGDAILDRLVHHAHTLSRKGPSIRRKKPGKEDASPDHLA